MLRHRLCFALIDMDRAAKPMCRSAVCSAMHNHLPGTLREAFSRATAPHVRSVMPQRKLGHCRLHSLEFHLHRALETHEEAGAGALLRCHVEQVLPLVRGAAGHDLVVWMPHLAQQQPPRQQRLLH